MSADSQLCSPESTPECPPEPDTQSCAAGEVLLDLERLLAAERDALVRLDRDAIEGFAARKLELDQQLRDCVAVQPLAASERALLERVRQAALSNQLLLAHARSCVQG